MKCPAPLKTAWAAPFVATGTSKIIVETADYGCQVNVTLDRIQQTPRVAVTKVNHSVKIGTRITFEAGLHWPDKIIEFLQRTD
ncbi:hypothetical protein CCP3SC5AM1_1720003 [Gammaproteobacteria bacterium]